MAPRILARVGGVVLAGGLVVSCARPVPPPPTAGPAPDPARHAQLERDHAALEEAHQKLQEDYRTLDQSHQKLAQDYRKLDQSHHKLAQDYRKLENALKKQTASAPDVEERLARLHLALLEKEAQIKLLTQKLDAAILEVVRAMAKLRSLESKAEAASNLAETEIALKLAERDSPGRKSADAAQAEKLLEVAGQEFKKENYGGALYLTTQAKGLLRSGAGRTAGSDSVPRIDGEMPFSIPLQLRVVGRAGVREGPGPGFKVAFAVPEGAPILGHSYKGIWVRVRSDDGRWGWLLYSQVGQP